MAFAGAPDRFEHGGLRDATPCAHLGDAMLDADSNSVSAFLLSGLPPSSDLDLLLAADIGHGLPEISRSGSTQPLNEDDLLRFTSEPVKPLHPRLLFEAASTSGEDMLNDAEKHSDRRSDAAILRGHKEKNRAAQRRFRQRQKARMATSAQQVQDLAAEMRTLQLDKQRLEAHNRVLLHHVRLSTHHIQDTAFEKEAFAKQQERILMETGGVYWRGIHSEPLSLEEAKGVTMEAFLKIFEHFLGRYQAMLDGGGRDPTTAAGRELAGTVLDRRQEEGRAALFSHWASACYAWNREETGRGLKPPSMTFWTGVLDKLELSSEQQSAMLASRRRLLKALPGIRRERELTILELGLAAVQHKKGGDVDMLKRRLRDSLEQERESVLDFLYTIVDCTLHPWQEAAADLQSHPWHPDLWAFCSILAARKGGEPPDLPAPGPAPTASLLPHFSTADMLWTPTLARGAGLQMKRVLASRATPEDAVAAAQRPVATIEQMRGMTVYELFCGKHLEAGGELPSVPGRELVPSVETQDATAAALPTSG